MQLSAADSPPGPEPTIATSTVLGPRPIAPERRPVAIMCSIATRPRLAAFLTSGLPATSPIRYWPGTAVWKFSSISGILSGGGVVPSGNITSASVGHANMHASHWMQSSNRSTRLLFATRSSTLVGHTATHASQPVHRSSLMSWTRIAGPTVCAGATSAWWRLRADSIVNTTISRMAKLPSASGTTQVTDVG